MLSSILLLALRVPVAVDAAGGGLPIAPRLITELGASGAGPGLLIHPYGVALDGSGDVFATDVATSTVDEYNSSTVFVRSFGGAGAGRLSDPRGVTVAPSGDVVVADTGNNRVAVFDGVGTFVRRSTRRGIRSSSRTRSPETL